MKMNASDEVDWSRTVLPKENNHIYIILPLAGRSDTFKRYIFYSMKLFFIAIRPDILNINGKFRIIDLTVDRWKFRFSNYLRNVCIEKNGFSLVIVLFATGTNEDAITADLIKDLMVDINVQVIFYYFSTITQFKESDTHFNCSKKRNKNFKGCRYGNGPIQSRIGSCPRCWNYAARRTFIFHRC